MNSPGSYVLGSLQITAPRALALLTPITGLEGMLSAGIEANFQGASGGTTMTAIVATSFDGTLWRHIARFDWTTTPLIKTANLSALTPKGVLTYADLASEGVTDGLLGTSLALYIVSTGTYTNGVLTVRATCR